MTTPIPAIASILSPHEIARLILPRREWRTLEDILYELDVLMHLRTKGFPAACPVRCEDGTLWFFDFDCGGPGYQAYDLAVFLWCCRLEHAVEARGRTRGLARNARPGPALHSGDLVVSMIVKEHLCHCTNTNAETAAV